MVATNSPFHLTIPIHTKQAPYRTYVLAAKLPRGVAPDSLVWDTLEPAYHYVRVQPGAEHDLVIVGGEDHKTGEADDMAHRFALLENWSRALFPEMGDITHRWSGQVLEPADYVPFIGPSPQHERVWLVTGDSGEGLTTGVAASLILRDQVNGRSSPWESLYDPSRSMVHGLGEYLSENLDAARHWAAHLGSGEVESPDAAWTGARSNLKRRWRKSSGVSSARWPAARAERYVHARRLRRALEQFRMLLGLSLPRLPVLDRGRASAGAGQQTVGSQTA